MTSDNADFNLPSSLTVENVQEIGDKLQSLIGTPGKTLILDASAVEIVTTAGAQLLVALDKKLRGSSGKLILRGPRPSMTDIFTTLGLSKQLEEWCA